MTAPPRHHTRRNPDRATLGPAVGAVASAFGRPFMPWQQYAADVINEIDPATGLLWYDTIVMYVQRQAGKSDMTGTHAHHRGLTVPAGRFWYTAQSGLHASEWMRDEYFERLHLPAFQRLLGVEGSARARYMLSRRNGREAMVWKHTRAKWQAFPPTANALHSKQADWIVADESWDHDAEKGQELRQAFRPAMNSRPGAQLWVVSAGGHASSDYLNDYLELAELSLTDPASRIAFIDYGIPRDADPEDLDVIAEWHPAFNVPKPDGSLFFDMPRLVAARADFSKDPAGFARAYGNRATGAREAAFPPGSWDECGAGRGPDRPAGARIAVDVTPDGTRVALVAAWTAGARTAVEVIYSGPIVDAGPVATRLRAAVAYSADNHANLEFVDALAEAGVETTPIGLPRLAAACNKITRLVIARTLQHFHQPDLDQAADLAVKRAAGDGGFRWHRGKSSGSIAELVAATLAADLATAAPTRKPVARTGTR